MGTELVRDLPQLSLRADVAPDSWNEDDYSFELVWTTGARVLRGFWDRFWEELSLDPKHVRMGRLQSGNAPFLDAHSAYDMSSQLGVIEWAKIEGQRGVAKARLAKGDPAAESLANKIRQKIARNISVGYSVHRMEKVSDGDNEIPVFRAVDWEPFEISAVPMGADAGAAVRSANKTSPCVFVDATARSATMANEQGGTAPATASVSAPPAAPAPAPAASATVAGEGTRSALPVSGAATASVSESEIRAAAVRDERERAAAIQRAVRAAKLGDDFASKLIADGVTADAARAAVLDHLASTSTASQIPVRGSADVTITDDASDKWVRGATAHIIVRSGNAQIVEGGLAKLGQPEKFDQGDFRGMDMVDLARDDLDAHGVKTRGMRPMDLMGKALTHRAGQQTLSNFSVATENALNKILLGYYAITPDTWSRFCGVTSVPDFRAVPMYQMGTLASLDEVGEGQPFTNQIVYDAKKESLTATTKGNILALSRQLLVNDDIGVFTQLAQQFGRAAALSVEKSVYALLAQNAGLGPTLAQDSVALFDAAHGNVGTGSAIGISALDADFAAMAVQTSPGSADEILDLKPEILLVPRALQGQAISLTGAEYEGNTNNPLPNRIRGIIRDVIGTGRLTGTRRYVFADPAIAPVIMVGFLDGNRTPYLESKEGWRVDGIEWKVRLDFGVAAVGFRGAVTNAGV